MEFETRTQQGISMKQKYFKKKTVQQIEKINTDELREDVFQQYQEQTG